jgi:hypothetical protein
MTDERKEELLEAYAGWYAGLEGYPSEFQELLSNLNVTDEEHAEMIELRVAL